MSFRFAIDTVRLGVGVGVMFAFTFSATDSFIARNPFSPFEFQ